MSEYTISDLAARSGVTHRTIRYYVEIGLLPPPEGAGRAAAYTEEHLDRLQLIKRLQAARLSLDEIREELGRTKPGTDSALLARAGLREPAAPYDSAADYLARLREAAPVPREARPASIASEPLARMSADPALFAEPSAPAERGESFVAEPWTRIPLSPDVELHVRRRGNRTDHRIARLIKEARRILNEDDPRAK